MPRGIIQLELVCHAAGTLVCYWFLLFFFLLKAFPFPLLKNFWVYVHNYQNAKSSASYLLRNVRLWDTKSLILHKSDELGLSVSWNEDSFFILKMAFIDPTFVRQLYLLLLGILWDIMNKASIALFLLKKKKETCFSSQHNSDVACVWHVGPMSDSRVTCLRWVPVKMRALGRTGMKLFPLFWTASGSDSGRS